MGRRKVEIKRIENKSRRQITFCKRRNGLMEKARQLSILCGSSVALFIVSATGKLYSFSSGDSIAKILSHYEIKHADDLKTLRETGIEVLALESLRRGCKLCGTPNLVLKGSCRKNSELSFAQGVQCDLEEANVSINCLMSLEEQLKIALSLTKARKFDTILNALLQTKLMVELVKTFQEKEKLLREENQVLASQMGKNKMKKFRETEDDRDMSPGNSSGNTSPETLPLLK